MSHRIAGTLAAAAALVACLLLPVGAASAASVTSPQGSLTAVSASAANNAWAVGCRPAIFQCPFNGADNAWAGGYTRNTVNFTLLMNWKASSWKRVTSGLGIGSPAGFTYVFGVAAASSSNVWAVGSRILHWNGTTWKSVSIPALPGGGLSNLTGVAATSGSNAWAVGSYDDPASGPHIVILRWNGRAWTRVR